MRAYNMQNQHELQISSRANGRSQTSRHSPLGSPQPRSIASYIAGKQVLAHWLLQTGGKKMLYQINELAKVASLVFPFATALSGCFITTYTLIYT